MWEEERKKRKGKAERLFSNGVIILIFLILVTQSVFFARHLIINNRRTIPAAENDTMEAKDVPYDSEHSDKRQTAERPDGQEPGNSAQHKETVYPGKNRNPDLGTECAADTQTLTERDSGRIFGEEEEWHLREFDYDGWKWDMVELNSADSAALDALPGIGPYYALQILRYRDRLGGYADISQLLDIRGFDTARLNRLTDRLYIEPSSVRRLDLRILSMDSMAAHPYIGPYAAKGIDRLRRTTPDSLFSLQTVIDNGILPEAQARRLALYVRN